MRFDLLQQTFLFVFDGVVYYSYYTQYVCLSAAPSNTNRNIGFDLLQKTILLIAQIFVT